LIPEGFKHNQSEESLVQIMSTVGSDKMEVTLGRVLKLLRNAEGITAAELAGRLGWSSSYISALETGKKEPTLRVLNGYGQYFGISPATLLYILEENLHASNAELMIKVLENKVASEERKRQTAPVRSTSKKDCFHEQF